MQRYDNKSERLYRTTLIVPGRLMRVWVQLIPDTTNRKSIAPC